MERFSDAVMMSDMRGVLRLPRRARGVGERIPRRLEGLVAEVVWLHQELGEIKSEIERRRRIEGALELERHWACGYTVLAHAETGELRGLKLHSCQYTTSRRPRIWIISTIARAGTPCVSTRSKSLRAPISALSA